MRLTVTIASLLGLATIALAFARVQGGTELKAGDAAPSFSLAGSDGQTYSLEQFRGKKAVVIAWFPKAFTGG